MGYTIPNLSNESMLDLLRQAYPVIEKEDPAMIARDNQLFFVADLLSKHKKKGGARCTWSVNAGKGTSARHSSWTDEDAVSIEDNMIQAHMTWAHADYSVSWVRQELLATIKEGKMALFDLLKERWKAEQLGALEELEEKLWVAPASPAEAQTVPGGIPFWIQKNTSSTGGFEGGNPSGFSDGAGGIDSTTYTGWQNYTDTYTNVTNDDLMDKMTWAMRKMKFKRPQVLNKGIMEEGPKGTRIVTNYDVKKAMDVLVRNNNDSLGYDLATREPVFRGTEVEWIPYLDADSDNPIYLIDMDAFGARVLDGDYFAETKVQNADRHNVFSVMTDLTYQYVCMNRRKVGVICLGA